MVSRDNTIALQYPKMLMRYCLLTVEQDIHQRVPNYISSPLYETTNNIDGVVFTMYDSRTNLSMQVVENVKQNLNQKVYNTLIPRNIRLAEAPSYGMPINMYDPKSAGAEAYMQLAEEVIKNK